MRYEILRLAKGGAGVSTVTGKVFFVDGGLPGETGEAEVTEEKSGFGRARVLTREKTSECRLENDLCPMSRHCDGCGFRHVRSEFALKLKAESVYADIVRNAHLSEIPYDLYGLTGDIDGKRRRLRLHVDGGRLGFFARGTHRIISASQCAVIAPELRDVVLRLEKMVKFPESVRAEIQMDLDCDGRCFAHFKAVQMRQGRRGNDRRPDLGAIEKLAVKAQKTGIFAGIRYGETSLGEPYIREVIEPEGLQPVVTCRRTGDFGQATLEANAHIHRMVHDFVADSGAKSVADLYCGSGNLTFRAAMSAPVVDGFEFFCDRAAFEAGRKENASRFVDEAGVSLHLCDLNGAFPERILNADVIICDPAREGLSEAVASGICRSRAASVLYVSCEASCLARDFGRLTPIFNIDKLAFIDMFPQTPHVETVAWLSRRSK